MVQARLFGFLVTAVGVMSVVSALSEPWHDRLWLAEQVLTSEATRLAAGTAAVAGVALVILGRGVAQRRRVACYVTIVLLVVATVAHLAKGMDVEQAVVTATLAGLLWWRRGVFVVPVPAARMRGLGRLTATMLVAAVSYGVVGLVSHAGQVVPTLTPGRVTAEVAARLVGLSGPLRVEGRFGDWFPQSLTVLGAIMLATVLLVVLAPVALHGSSPHADRRHIQRLVDRVDGDSLDPFVLRRDKRWIFAPSRRAAIGYRYVRGVGLAAGDPIGDPADFGSAIRAFLDTCEHHGWRPALFGVRSDRLPVCRQQGLRAFCIGDEAILDMARFTLDGRPMRNVRQMVNRVDRAGVTTDVMRESELDPQLHHALRDVARAHHAGHRELGFSMTLGSLLTGAFPNNLLVICRDQTGRAVAFQRYAPCRAGRTLSLDVMCRLPDAPAGVNERMITTTIDWARTHDVSEVSLNFAAFRTLLDPDTNPDAGQAVEAFVLQRIEGHLGLQMDTLRRFNAKFQPRWVPRHLAYRSHRDLPAIAFALLSAEGYLPFDPTRQP